MTDEAIKLFACPSYECTYEGDAPGTCPECDAEKLQERTHELRLPGMFWTDHAERALPAGHLLKWHGQQAVVRCSDFELSEIRSDASHYAHPHGPDADGLGSLIRSAKATVRAIDKYAARAAELEAIKARSASKAAP